MTCLDTLRLTCRSLLLAESEASSLKEIEQLQATREALEMQAAKLQSACSEQKVKNDGLTDKLNAVEQQCASQVAAKDTALKKLKGLKAESSQQLDKLKVLQAFFFLDDDFFFEAGFFFFELIEEENNTQSKPKQRDSFQLFQMSICVRLQSICCVL